MRKRIWGEALHVFYLVKWLFVILPMYTNLHLVLFYLYSCGQGNWGFFFIILSFRPFPACVKINIRTSGKPQRNGQSVLTIWLWLDGPLLLSPNRGDWNIPTDILFHPSIFWGVGWGRGDKEKRLLIFLFLNLSSCLYSASPLCSTRVKYLVEGEMEKSVFGREDGQQFFFLTFANSFTLFVREETANQVLGRWNKKMK